MFVAQRRLMAKLNDIVKFLNKELKIRKIKDSSKNGLQFKAGKEINKAGFAVDACLSTFEKAAKAGCDLLVVHHGLLWKKKRGWLLLKQRMRFLKKHKISLYAAHL
ncbi:Nif3-like dinuclear metal center hexameric protein, partial [Elusimicrobiota bacterium]